MRLIVLKVSSWTEVKYMDIFLLVVKDSTGEHTQNRWKVLRCVIPGACWKNNSELISVRNHNYNCMLDDGIYWQSK